MRLPRLSLTIKIGAALATLVAVSLSLHLLLNDARSRLIQQKRVQAKQLAEIVAGIVRKEMVVGAPERVQEHLDAILGHPDVHDIRIFGVDGTLRFALVDSLVGHKYDRNTHVECRSCHAGQAEPPPSIVRNLGSHQVFTQDVRLSNEALCADCHQSAGPVLGNLLLDLHFTEPDIAALVSDRRLAMTGLLLVTLTVAGVWVLVGSMVVRPIRSLVSAAREVEDGNFEPQFPKAGRDEIGDLVAAFERMTQRLSGLVRHQEKVIEERTSELRKSQEQAMHHEKMVALGRLTGGLAHEVGNPLASISGMVQMLARKSDDPNVRQTAQDVLEHVQRINRIVRDMLEHYHPGERHPAPVEVSALIEDALRVARYDRELKRVEIETLIDKDCPRVFLVEDELLQVLLNILLNSADAMPDGGGLRIQAKPTGDGGVTIEIADTGYGIPAEDLNRIFDPFFTSKPPGKGTGLGLWVSYSIVQRWGGDIEVESVLDEGTTVRLTIPSRKETEIDVSGHLDR